MLCQTEQMGRSLAYLCCFALSASSCLGGVVSVHAQPAPGTAGFDPSNPPTQTLVMRGETLFTIAERTRSPLQALIRVNNLAPPYAISPGQVLALPPLKVHVVAANETFTAIARRYSVDERSLAVFNRLPRPVQLRIGQKIILPPMVIDRFTGLEPQDLLDLLANEINAGRDVTGTIPGQIVRNSEASSPNSPPPASAPTPRPPIMRTIGPASDGNGDVSTNVPFGSPVLGPSEDGDGVAVNPRSTPKGNVRPPTGLPRTQTASLSPLPPRPSQPPPTLSGPTDMPAPSTSDVFAWPINNGRIIETFGTKQDLRVLDGIEIEAPAGTPFKAAAGGRVVYVGNQLPGYGWLVLIRHSDGIMSAYAYAQSVNVHENQTVTRGQVIGLVGTTGRATTPRLHFQIRQNTKPVDPVPRLPRLRAAA
jgi:murein DD-endopeptidase MepM/ murein hydrolase activator NlpD